MTTSPLVTAYLADLDRALAGADPADRLEIVDAVREHIDAAVGDLGASPSQAEIAGVLRRLGTADDVAAAWASGADRPVLTVAPRAGGYAGAAYGAGIGSAQPGYPPRAPSTRSGLPGWAIALIVVAAVLLAGPILLAVIAPLLVARAGAGNPQAFGSVITLTTLLAVATILAGIRRRRAPTHRRGWLVAFAVGCALTAAAALLGVYVFYDGRSSGSAEPGPAVIVEKVVVPYP